MGMLPIIISCEIRRKPPIKRLRQSPKRAFGSGFAVCAESSDSTEPTDFCSKTRALHRAAGIKTEPALK
jgi:hypothetical protein